MSTAGSQKDPLAEWDPPRRAALERIRRQFKDAGGDQINLVDELLWPTGWTPPLEPRPKRMWAPCGHGL